MIRKFQETDTAQVLNIWLKGNEEAHPFVSGDYWKANQQEVGRQLLQARVFVCEEDGEIRGFIGIVEKYIAGIFVAGQYRSLGIGKRLLDHVKGQYDSLSLSVYRKNRRAAAFYSREQRAKRTCEHVHLATAARVKNPAACCEAFDSREGFSLLSEGVDEATGEAEDTMIWKAESLPRES